MHRIYSILLGVLLLTLLMSPLSSLLGGRGEMVEGLLFASLVMAAFGASTPKQRRVTLLILAAAGALRLAGRSFQVESASVVALLAWMIVAVLAAYKAVRFALGGGPIDSQHICAALSVYMLAGHFYGLAYWRLEHAVPGSFTMDCRAQLAGSWDLASAIYFSFISLATVGYGDIVPSTALSRGLVVTETISGQFYMVVLVARLVSLYSQNQISRESTTKQ